MRNKILTVHLYKSIVLFTFAREFKKKIMSTRQFNILELSIIYNLARDRQRDMGVDFLDISGWEVSPYDWKNPDYNECWRCNAVRSSVKDTDMDFILGLKGDVEKRLGIEAGYVFGTVSGLDETWCNLSIYKK